VVGYFYFDQSGWYLCRGKNGIALALPTLLQTRLQMAQLFEFGEFQQGKEKVVD
jgi:hypothetical protein